MSFIYENKNLINDLIRFGQDFEDRFSKKAQNTDPQGISSIGLTLLDDLEDKITPGQPVVSSEINNPAGLFDPYLEGLGTLVKYVAVNKIMINYHRIAYDNSSEIPQKDISIYTPTKLEGNALFVGTAEDPTIKHDLFVNKELLIEYLKSLQATANQQKIPVMEVKLKALIAEANNKLNLKLDPNYKPTTKPGEAPAKPGEKPGETPGTPGAAGAASAVSNIHSLVQFLPLSRSDIDFTRIERFFTDVKSHLAKFVPNHPEKSSIESNIQNAEELIGYARSHIGKNIIQFPTDWDSLAIALSRSGQIVATIYLPFLDQLKQIVAAAANVVASIYSMYGNKLTADEQSAMTAQFKGPGSIQIANTIELQGLEGHINDVKERGRIKK